MEVYKKQARDWAYTFQYEKQARDWAYMIQYEKLSKEDRKVAITEFNISVNSLLNNCAPNERLWLSSEMDELRRKIGA